GHLNWQEWVAGTDPSSTQSVLRVGNTPGNWRVTDSRLPLTFPSVTDKIYRVLTATILGESWELTAHATSVSGPLVTDPIAGTGGPITVYVDVGNGIRFAAITVE
ncbi:MAG: hypothetical protein WAS34_00490, partial [Thiolinea sp.]